MDICTHGYIQKKKKIMTLKMFDYEYNYTKIGRDFNLNLSKRLA